MARLVIVFRNKLLGLPEFADNGLDLHFSQDGPLWGESGSIRNPHLRFHCNTKGRASVVKLPGCPPLHMEGSRLKNSKLSHHSGIEGAGCHVWLWAPAEEASDLPEEDLRTLFLMTRELSLVDFDQLINRMIDRLMEVFTAERGFILLKDTKTGVYRQAVARKIPESEMGRAASRTVVRRVIEQGRPITIGDAGEVLADAASVKTEGIRSVIAAPLVFDGGTLGVVYLDSRAIKKVFTRRELALLDAFSQHVSQAIAAILEKNELERNIQCLKVLRADETRLKTLIGNSASMTQVIRQINDVAREDITTLILGESGTGKELAARAIHMASSRAEGPFVAVNCMSLSREVMESELFGHEKGSFTGASERRLGRFELAAGGTIFLDEIGELDLDIQVKLLRVLEERQIERVGGGFPVDLDVRLITATNRNLREAVAEGFFREDLYYRINVFSIVLPPLRERPDDIPALVEHFISNNNSRMGNKLSGCSDQALDALMRYSWPGNIRELRNVIDRAFIIEKSDRITLSSLPFDISGRAGPSADRLLKAASSRAFPPETTLSQARESFELDFIRHVLCRNNGNVSRTAKELSIPRSTIYRKFAAAGIDIKEVIFKSGK